MGGGTSLSLAVLSSTTSCILLWSAAGFTIGTGVAEIVEPLKIAGAIGVSV